MEAQEEAKQVKLVLHSADLLRVVEEMVVARQQEALDTIHHCILSA